MNVVYIYKSVPQETMIHKKQENMNLFPILFPQAFFFSTLTIFQATFAHDLINSTCKILSLTNPNVEYDFCMTSLQPASTSQDASLVKLGTISIRLIHDNLTDTERHITQLLENDTWDSYTGQCLNDCLELYSDAIADTEDAMGYYKAQWLDDANQRISSVMTNTVTCQEGFEEEGDGATSPLTKRNDDAYRLSAIALGIMQMIKPVQSMGKLDYYE